MNIEEYIPTIGLEVHAELKTHTKMFCSSCNTMEDVAPNTHICPICMGHPGTLPTINKKAVESVLRVGLALNASLATYTEFDRKNYFYPDIPKGYQISQYAYPLVTGGNLNGVAITRVHLEEDTARSLHDQGEGSIVDYNRAGVPLMELVTEPVIHDAKTAGNFARELQLLLRTLGVSDAQMERGQMRVEANISVSKGDKLGTKVEVKNLNSFRSVEGAIEFEISRQIEALESGEVLVQETRGWDEQKQKTFSQRKKESSHDYRYFPDPDLPKLKIDIIESFNISRLSEIMPELPSNKRIKYENLGLTRNNSTAIVSNIEASTFFDKVIEISEGEEVKLAANYLISDIFGLLIAKQDLDLGNASVSGFIALIKLLQKGTITSRVAKDLLFEVLFEQKDPLQVVTERGLVQKDSSELTDIVESILNQNPAVVAEYKLGKESAIQFLIGQGMKITKGSANPESLKKLFAERMN